MAGHNKRIEKISCQETAWHVITSHYYSDKIKMDKMGRISSVVFLSDFDKKN
jgi:hypothetical protein